MNDRRKLILIRHGEGTHNVGGFYSGDPSMPGYKKAHLTPTGRVQVAASCERLVVQDIGNICRLISSPLPRTVETSDIVIDNLGISRDCFSCEKRFIEASMGDREGTNHDLYKEDDAWFPVSPEHFGGETRQQIRSRVLGGLAHLLSERKTSGCGEGSIAIVSHGVPIYLALEAFKGKGERLPTAGYALLPIDACVKQLRELGYITPTSE